jgi:hypothetical protein
MILNYYQVNIFSIWILIAFGAVIFLSVFGQPFATHRWTRLEGVLAVLGKIRGGGPVWDVESGGTIGVRVADCQRSQSRARLKPKTMTVTFEEFSPTHDFFDYTGSDVVDHIPEFSRLYPISLRWHLALAILDDVEQFPVSFALQSRRIAEIT